MTLLLVKNLSSVEGNTFASSGTSFDSLSFLMDNRVFAEESLKPKHWRAKEMFVSGFRISVTQVTNQRKHCTSLRF